MNRTKIVQVNKIII